MRLLTTVLLLTAPLLTGAASPNDPRWDTCVLCHGTAGRGNEPVAAPRIGGMEAWYIENQLDAFRAGWRGVHPDDLHGAEMRPSALDLEDDGEIRDAAEHFAAFDVVDPRDTVRGDVDRGRELYAACASCHGEAGEGRAALQSPALAHQSDWYLVRQLEHYRSGVRGSAEGDLRGAQMAALAVALGDPESVRDVVAYINTLEPTGD